MPSPPVFETVDVNSKSNPLDEGPPEPSSLRNSDDPSYGSMEYQAEHSKHSTNGANYERRTTEQTDLTRMLDNDDLSDAGCCYRMLRKCPRAYKCLLRWPRTSAIILGVTFPLLFLILVSTVFGSILATFEAPLEVEQNDNYLAQSTLELTVLRAVVNITTFVPQICLAMYFNGLDLADLRTRFQEYVLLGPNATFPALFGDYISPGVLVTVNSSEIFEYMNSCGNAAGPIVERLFRNTSTAFTKASFDSLTFNWIRCYPGANGLGGSPSAPTSIDEFRYDAQYAWYTETWRKSQQQLFDTFLQQNLEANMSSSDAKEQAKRSSFLEASGIDGCEVNAPASGWWWFIMLSTVGYGNYVPYTSSGRAMVITLGFLSILAFAGILSVAGLIASAIFDDCLVRLRFKTLTHPAVAMVVWGSLYYTWMVRWLGIPSPQYMLVKCFLTQTIVQAVIMAVVVEWMQARVGDTTFTNAEGYWFAYISSTTVGFGDIYLPAEVFLYRDLLTFPLMWLVGFVLVAAFIAKFADTWITLLGKRSYVVDVLDRLHKTHMLHDLPSAGEMVSERWRKRFTSCCPRRTDGDDAARQATGTGAPNVEGDRH